MRKVGLVVLLLALSTWGLFAAGPDYFAFTLGSGGAYDVSSGAIVSGNNMGFTYSFNGTFSGGFSFVDIGGNSIDVVSMSVSPADKVLLTVHTGQVAGQFGFGAGIGYNLFENKEGFFTALSLNFDWYAGNGGAYDIANGGILSIGLRTMVGL